MGRFTVSAPSQPGRFSAGRFYVAPEAERWLPTNSPLVAKRRKPDGTWEYARVAPGEPAPRAKLPGNLAASPAAGEAAAQGRGADVGAVDVAPLRGPWNPMLGPPEGSAGPPRSPLGERLSADVASNAFGPFVGLAERAGEFAREHPAATAAAGLVFPPAAGAAFGARDLPSGTREALREEAARLQEQEFLADPEGGVGRAVAQTGREILTSLPGPSLLLGPAAGKGGALLARGSRLGRLGQGVAAATAGAAEQGAENFFDTVDLPTRERLASVALGAGLGLAGGVGDIRAGAAGALDPTEGIEAALARELAEATPVPTRAVQNPPLVPRVPTRTVQADRRSNLGLRREVDDALVYLRQEQPEQARLADIQAKAGQAGDRAMELATERYAFERGKGFFGPPPKRPPLAAPARVADDLPSGAGLRPREPEIAAPGAAGEVSRETPAFGVLPEQPPLRGSERVMFDAGSRYSGARTVGDAIDALERDNPKLWDSLMAQRAGGNEALYAHFVAGWHGEPLKRVVGWRYGAPPESGQSFNTRDAAAERGVSIMGFRPEDDLTNGTFALFNDSRPKHAVEGWVTGWRGADGEPLLVGARDLGPLDAYRGESTPPPDGVTSRPVAAPVDSLPQRPEATTPPPRMSTKGLETFADPALREGVGRVAAENIDEIYATRGAPVPVSRWHDAPALQAKLGLTPKDYLEAPPGTTFGSDQLALGKHYLGNMKRQAQELDARIASGQVDDLAAAQAEKAVRDRDVVLMMAKLASQGSSEFGRMGRMLQEALDPRGLAETPKEQLQLALLKHYGAKNAEEAGKIEARAVARLQRQVAREGRKAARAVTAQELSAEFGSLLGELDSLTKRPRGMGGGPVPLDPELVAVIGRMAKNRIRAGVVAVEELADAVYSAVRQVAGDTISREQVKASIVEGALARPPKPAPGEVRLRRAEAAAQKSIERMEASVAAGGAKAPKPVPVTSPALEKLRARQVALREQLASLRGKPATDPAVRRLKTAEVAAERRVKKLEERLARGPALEQSRAKVESERLASMRQRAADLKSQIAKDPRHGLVERYRQLLDDETVEQISRLPDPLEDPDALLQFLRRMETPTFKDYMGSYVYNNLLSGPKSLLRNVVGNAVKRWDRVAVHPLASAIEQVLAPLQGRLPERYVREIIPMVVGSYAGAPAALQKALWVLKNGWDPERVVGELTGVKGNAKYYEGRLPVDPFLLSENRAVRAFGAVHGYGPRLMQVGDVMARSRNFTSASYAWATRQAINDVKRGAATDVAARAAELLKEQPDAMLQYAQRVAREDTFQDEVSNMARVVGMARREQTGLGFGLSQVVRFLNVPDRIAAWLADYTPGLRIAGAAFPEGKLRKVWGTPEASDLLARQAFGTALAAAAAAWAFHGKLTGGMPKDEKLRNDAYAAGKQPWSVLVGGQWVPIRDLFGGWAAPVAAAAAFHDSAMTGEPVDSEEILRRSGGAALGEAKFLLDANYLANLSDTVSAIQADPSTAGEEAVSVAANVAGGALVPWSGLQRGVAVWRDPRVVEKDGFVDELKANIPGLRESLPARISPQGEELRIATGKAGAFLPVVPTESKLADPGLAEDVERLRFTVARRRSEINRVLDQIKDARKSKDAGRERELKALLPAPADRVQGDAALARVRGLEAKIRKLRADEKAPVERRRLGEIALQKQMQKILADALRRMGSG